MASIKRIHIFEYSSLIYCDSFRYVPLPLPLSHTSTVDFVMDRLETYVDKRKGAKGATITVPMGKKLVIFVDDLHAPQPEVSNSSKFLILLFLASPLFLALMLSYLLQEFGTRPPIEFLREFLDTHGWYDRKERLHFREGEEDSLREERDNSILLIGAMTLPKGGINRY